MSQPAAMHRHADCVSSVPRVAFVTGAAGFIGSHLVDALLRSGIAVRGWDNFSTGQESFLATATQHPRFEIARGDILDLPRLTAAMHGCDCVFHFAASADVRSGLAYPRRDLEQNTIGTHNVLEAMRVQGLRRLVFASTGSIYGEASVYPTPEDAPMPVQTSLYGASKLAGEGLISAYAEGYGFHCTILRLVSVLGARYTHGHIWDFFRQLRANPNRLRVLGDGHQRKSYLHIDDCIEAIMTAAIRGQAADRPHRTAIYNVGSDATCEVLDSVRWIAEQLGVSPDVEFTGGPRGWAGDNPFIYLATDRIRTIGWKPRHSIEQAVASTVHWLRDNPWIFACRE